MSDTTAGMRDTMLLGMACAAGVMLSPMFPYAGLPVTAAAAAGLAFSGRMAAAILAALAGVAAVALLLPGSAAFAAATALIVLLAVWQLPHRSTQLTAAVLTLGVAASAIVTDSLAARSSGVSLTEAVRAEATGMTGELTRALGASGSAWAEQLQEVRDTLVLMWPSFYVQSALFGAVLVVAAIAWAARRNGVGLNVPVVKQLDLSVHVLWLLVLGLVALAAGAFIGPDGEAVRIVGLNALYIARTLFFLQGIAVLSALFDVPKTGHGKMVALYLVLYLLDQLLLIVSLTGLLDFWANFRRLPRDGSGTPLRVEDPSRQYTE